MDRNVYEACNDLITEFQSHVVSADEILAQKINYSVPVPFLSRDDLNQYVAKDKQDGLFHGNIMPNIDLRVLHYFFTQLVLQRYPHLINCFDETSLITLGLLIEQWVDEFLISFNNDNCEDSSESDSDNDEESVATIGAGPAESLSKMINYRDYPTDI